MDRPKKLYNYYNHRLDIHECNGDFCNPEYINLDDGKYYVCRHPVSDYYGFALKKDAKNVEIKNIKHRIKEEKKWLKKLKR